MEIPMAERELHTVVNAAHRIMLMMRASQVAPHGPPLAP
jgi:hypothetical protein